MGNQNNLKEHNYRIKFSYDGKDFYGYQKQPSKVTIQEELEEKISLLVRDNIKLVSSGRTDKGVHAKEQVANFITKKEIRDLGKFIYSLNKIIKDTIYIKEVKEVPLSFSSRFSSKDKTYQYVINNKEYDPLKKDYELFIKDKIDLERIEEVLPLFIGQHNFKNFTSKKEDEKDFIRTIYSLKLTKTKTGFTLIFKGDGFMRYQIRKIVGTIIAYSLNKISLNEIKIYLEKIQRSIVPFQVPSKGLYLVKVRY